MAERPEKRLFPTILDDRARDTPDRVYSIVPQTGNVDDGYRNISASNKVAWWLESEIGKSTTFDTIAYIGPTDLRYTFLVIAATKVGYKVVLPLPSNTPEAQLELLEVADCKVIIASKGMESRWDTIRKAMPHIKSLSITSFDDLVDYSPVVPYPYVKTYAEGKDDPFHIIHTSGTTGKPKPITYTHYMSVAFYHERAASTASNTSASLLYTHHRVLNPLPPSWLFGLAMILHLPLGFDAIPVLLPAEAPRPLTAAYIDSVHQAVELDGGVYVPDTLVQLSKNRAYLATMKERGLKFILYGGAPSPKETGDMYARFLKVQPLIGSSEIGSYAISEADQEDWQYYRFQDDSGFESEEFDAEEGLYEMLLRRDAEEEKKQNVFCVFPDLDLYRTSDLWRPHATKRGLWLYCGRTDDFVKLGSLTKFWASHVEQVLERLPGVRGVLMAGSERQHPFLLVELEDGTGDNEKKIDAIWPSIEQANKGIADEIRIQKALILLTKPEKPMRRTDKSRVKRRDTSIEYEVEIQELYENRRLEGDSGKT